MAIATRLVLAAAVVATLTVSPPTVDAGEGSECLLLTAAVYICDGIRRITIEKLL